MIQSKQSWLRGLTRNRQTAALVSATVVLLGAAAGFYSLVVFRMHRPAEGVVLKRAEDIHSSLTAAHTLTTPFYTATYPATFRALPRPAHSASLDAELLVGQQQRGYGTSSHLALTVVALAAGGVAADSSYLLYKTHPETYSLAQQTVGSDTLTVAARTQDGYEKIYLWPHGTLLLTIDYTAQSASATADADMQSLIQGLRWSTDHS